MATTAADAYPDSRFDRSPPSSIGGTPLPQRSATPPRSRYFTVEMGAAASRRGTVSTPKIIGPAVVLSVKIKHRTSTDPPGFSWELGWSTFPITEDSVVLTTPKPWNALVERLRHFYETPLPGLVGSVQVSQVGGGTVTEMGLESPILVTAPEFYLTMTAHNVTAAVNPFASWVEINVLENMSPEAAANFR